MLNNLYETARSYFSNLGLPQLAYSGVSNFSSSRSKEPKKTLAQRVQELVPLAHLMHHKGATNLHVASTKITFGRNGSSVVVDKEGSDRFRDESVIAYCMRKTGLSHGQVSKRLKEHNRK